jgi:2-polyprenyl-6-methoxyphenol hydroxylase-like FAD-dependent oxidoreductase
MPIKTALIIGSGVAGPLAALSLHAHNITPHIFESRSSPSTIGGAINLSPNAVRILSNHNLLPRLLAHGCSVQSLEISSAHSGKRLGTITFGDVQKYGFDSLRVLRSELQAVLLAALEEKGIRVTYDRKLVGVREEETAVTAVFEDGTTATGDMLIGADGIRSAVRRSYVDPAAKATYTGVSSAYGVVDFAALGIDNLHFLTTGLSSSRKGSFLMSFCNAEKTRIFWAVIMGVAEDKVPDRTAGWKAKEQQETKRGIVERFSECQALGGVMEKAVMNTPEVCFYPINQLPLGGRWWRGRCVLIGDAAHAVSNPPCSHVPC